MERKRVVYTKTSTNLGSEQVSSVSRHPHDIRPHHIRYVLYMGIDLKHLTNDILVRRFQANVRRQCENISLDIK